MLNYCQIKSKRNQWIGCECVFTVVNDVLVGCTSVYREGERSLSMSPVSSYCSLKTKVRKGRAKDAPIIRQLFSSSPRDPRYHMLSYISSKFSQGPKASNHEPRAALFLNRFTRTLTIMYATNGLEHLLGISSNALHGKSFYYCIQENCLPEAIRVLESAKANDSIAYLRFWFRNPGTDDLGDQDEAMSDAASADNDDDDDGGVQLTNGMDTDTSDYAVRSTSSGFTSSQDQNGLSPPRNGHNVHASNSSGSSASGHRPSAIFDHPSAAASSASSLPAQVAEEERRQRRDVELEAVVSCTSDGLVVILRAARPLVLSSIRESTRVSEPRYKNGLFASPWGSETIIPNAHPQGTEEINASYRTSGAPAVGGNGQVVAMNPPGPPTEDFMNTIREVAVFAWALTGINGSLAQYSRGTPMPGAQPYSGMPVWEHDVTNGDVDMDSEFLHKQ